MKKVISTLAIAISLCFGFNSTSFAQEDSSANNTEVVDAAQEGNTKPAAEADEEPTLTFVQTIKQKYSSNMHKRWPNTIQSTLDNEKFICLLAHSRASNLH